MNYAASGSLPKTAHVVIVGAGTLMGCCMAALHKSTSTLLAKAIRQKVFRSKQNAST